MVEATDPMGAKLENYCWWWGSLRWGGEVELTIFLEQSMGPLYRRFDLSAAYWICRRALMCSTGAAMKDTVQPAMTPAMAWPTVGSFSAV